MLQRVPVFAALHTRTPHPRRLLLFPKGNPTNRRTPDFISLFLDAGDVMEQDYPIGWQRIAQFDLILVNQADASKTIKKGRWLVPRVHAML